MRTFGLLPALLMLAWSCQAANPIATHPLNDIQQTVADFLQGQSEGHSDRVRVRVKPLDSRIRMPVCDDGLTPFFPPGARRTGNIAVGVRCEGPHRWTVYATARVKLPRKIVVLARSLPRGSRLRESDVRLDERDTATLVGGYMTRSDEAVGKMLSRSLVVGQPVTRRVLTLPKAVRRGQRVTVLARIGGLEVRSEGKVLSDGHLGELVSVRNSTSRRVVEGIVSGAGTVVVGM